MLLNSSYANNIHFKNKLYSGQSYLIGELSNNRNKAILYYGTLENN